MNNNNIENINNNENRKGSKKGSKIDGKYIPSNHRLEVPISAEERSKHVLRVFLAGPDSKVTMVGKVYVAYLVMTNKGASGETACVDPWELVINNTGREVFSHISV